MIEREKMLVVSSILDDSIKSVSPAYDILLFSSFIELEQFINKEPIVVNTIIINTHELEFNGINMDRLIRLLHSSFLTIDNSFIYLISLKHNYDTVSKFFNGISDIRCVVYQGDLSIRFISDIISGDGRSTSEEEKRLITYRVRADEYIKQHGNISYRSPDDHYVTDEDMMAGIPDIPLPETPISYVESISLIDYIVGTECIERTLLAFLIAQYRALDGKTLIMERDVDYHTLTDIVTKSNISYELITIDELFRDFTATVSKIRLSDKQLIVIGCIKCVKYDYNFMFDELYDVLSDNIIYFVRECSYSDIPYGQPLIIACSNTVPEVIKCCTKIKQPLTGVDVKFIGVQIGTLSCVNISSIEMGIIIKQLLSIEKVNTQIMKVNGIVLRKGEVVNDIFSIVVRNNK